MSFVDFKKILSKSIEKVDKSDNKFIKIIRKDFPGSNYGSYYYSQRLGKNSLAFLLYDSTIDKFACLIQHNPAVDRFLLNSFTGSLDKNKKVREILLEEIKEESGYTIPPDEIKDRVIYLSKQPVSSQTNEEVYLYLINVTNLKQGKTIPDNDWEKYSYIKWTSSNFIFKNAEWKARIIVLEYLTKVLNQDL